MKSSAEIRRLYLDFFHKKGHTIVPSSSLVPTDDPTLLFTNAGMVQFKSVFLGQEIRPYTRAVTSQRCVRAGGKHNDLENVGYTARHHTFFEMLGNFSFGDYFKREAIQYAWQFLTEVIALPPEKLWITVFAEDNETKSIWLDEIGVDPARLSAIGTKDNFWSMGDTGPCGPCSEIFYDHGDHVAGGAPGSAEEDSDRYIEIWNLVFMQYNRTADGTMTPLPKPSVDTGMGLERLTAVLQNVHSNYDIDLFQKLIAFISHLTGTEDNNHPSLRVIADHIRSCAFMIADGVQPTNESRGYVLRRIIRRAVRHGHKLGLKKAFFHTLVTPLATEMGDAFPELKAAAHQIEQVLKKEEQRFANTLDNGLNILEQAIATTTDTKITGETIFLLYDTYGFPVDLTADIARERGLTLDIAGFERNMDTQRKRARSANQLGDKPPSWRSLLTTQTTFCGYTKTLHQATIIGILAGDKRVDILNEGQEGIIILDVTPFYAEAGGQVGDSGKIVTTNASFKVIDTHAQGGAVAHFGASVHGQLKMGDSVTAHVDEARRLATTVNHSATHLLHAALRNVLGEHVTQKGSLVDADRLRFDFVQAKPISKQQLDKIERLVNRQIRLNHKVETAIMDLEQAKQSGAIALFREKYSDKVRVLSMGDFSTELCGGTHVSRTGDIGLVKLIAETGIAAGVRRIEALTSETALDYINQNQSRLNEVAALIKATTDNVTEKTAQLVQRTHELEKQISTLKGKLATSNSGDLVNAARQIGNIKVLATELDNADSKSLRDTVDQLKTKLGTAVIILASVNNDKVTLIAGVTQDIIDKIRAGDLVAHVAGQVGGKGGGRADMAQGGGNQLQHLKTALSSVFGWVQSALED